MTEESVKTAESIQSKRLSEIYIIETEKLTNPKLKIVGIDTCLGSNIETLQKDIQARNFNKFTSNCCATHLY